MNKSLKRIIIALSALVVAFSIFAGVVSTYVLSPKKLTPMVQKQMNEMLICQTSIGNIESTFLSTFPQFGVKINNFYLLNAFPGAKTDTVVSLAELTAVIDLQAFWKKKDLVVKEIILESGSINAFTDSLGNSNLQVLADTITDEESDAGSSAQRLIDLHHLKFKNVNIDYQDQSQQINTSIRDFAAVVSGTLANDTLQGNLKVSQSTVDFKYQNKHYLQDALVQLDVPLSLNVSSQRLQLENAKVDVNDILLQVSGSIENDTLNQKIFTDIEYKFNSWPIDKILQLLQPIYQQPGLAAAGLISSQGTITGEYSEEKMPIIDLEVSLRQGMLQYPDLPVPLRNVESDFSYHSDLTDASSFVKINRFQAKTDSSSFSLEGEITDLLSDIRCRLNVDAQVYLDEFNPAIPAEMKTKLKGKFITQLKSEFTLAQLEKKQYEKIKLSGKAQFARLDIVYDSLSLQADGTEVKFNIPHAKPTHPKRKFAHATVFTSKLMAEQLSGFTSYLEEAQFDLEISAPDKNHPMPFAKMLFKVDSLANKTDSIQVAMAQPNGAIEITPALKAGEKPRFKIDYHGNQLATIYGLHSFNVDKINLSADIENDTIPGDIFQQWLVHGFMDLENGEIAIANLSHPIAIPAIAMEFDPENIDVEQSHIIIDQSDFQLNGKLHNLLSYFRGDSILRGKFNFNSEKTNITQLMNLTSGIGHEQDVKVEHKPAKNLEEKDTGPYLVPKGMDIVLNTKIKEATYGIDTASQITGNLRINDGLMLLDQYSLLTTAAKMQFSAMYKTPRKNHLYLGLDYHMLEVEIEQLLKTIPNIDSLMPMLRSFGGQGEFHLAIETYLDSLYNLKRSTLRGAASIKGQDLVLMDGETFSEIAKKLKFNKKTENVVDSLSAEFTIFRNEIDIYPFLLVMDKYKAVVAGRHNFDLTFDYHISVVDCPLPIKLGIDVKGTIDDLDYSLAKCRYKELYRPARRKVVENKQLELRNMIREGLTQGL